MSWYNNLGDFGGDLKSILGGHNPSNKNVFSTGRAPGFQPPPSINGLPTSPSALNLGPAGNAFENLSTPGSASIGGLNGIDTSNPGAAILSAAAGAARPNTTLSTDVGGLPGVSLTPSGTSIPGPTAAPFPGVSGTTPDPGASNGSGLLGSIGNFIEAHPNAVAMGLQGLGSLATIGADRRLKAAQAQALENQAGLTQNELEQRKKEQTALAPYFAQTAAATAGRRRPVARNPYLPPTSGDAGVTGG